MTDQRNHIGSTAKAKLVVSTTDGEPVIVQAQLDSGGSQNLASKEILQNIRKAEDYGRTPICMITVSGDTPAYHNMGELHFMDERDIPIVTLCYVQEETIKGHETFALICNDTLVDIDTDLNYHARTSKNSNISPLRRLLNQPYHYQDKADETARNKDTAFHSIAIEQLRAAAAAATALTEVEDAMSEAMTEMTVEELTEVEVLRITGRQLRKPPIGRINPKKDKQRFKIFRQVCFMSEIQLQSLLDRTEPIDGEEEGMDMTEVNGERISKYDIKALKVGSKVSKAMREELNKFNSNYIGAESVFPVKNGAPRILTQFKDNPYTLELQDQYTTGNKPKPLPTIKGAHYQGKPATCKVLEHFVRTTPVVERCDDPRCFSRLVIVPKRDPGTTKDTPPTSYRVTMDALINNCLKPVASTLPLATDEIRKLHGLKYFLKLDAMHAFWAIPLDEESKKLMAFQTHEGVFAWSRLTMGCRPASQVQQTAFHTAMDNHMPKIYRHRIALYADDMAAGADTLEELFEIYKALVITLHKAGIQVKASKVEFGVEEVTFHNYRVVGGDGPMANTTTPKDENLDPIKSCTVPQTVTQLKALLGATQQMSQYVPYYALVAAPLHRLTRKDAPFPSGSKWIKGSDYDMAYHHIKSLILDRPLYLWNKDNNRHLFIEVDSSDDGWGGCVYQYEEEYSDDKEAGKLSMFSKRPKRIISWVSKAWTNYEKASLPIFYKETIARLLCLEHHRNLIETQQPGHGITCYSDHLPGIKSSALSNKGKLSTWRIHETSDLTSIVETLYKSGPTMSIADPLSRLARQEHRLDNLDLPVLLEMLFKELPVSIRKATNLRVNAEKDTAVVTRIVQKWREPTNPISNTIGTTSANVDFLISAPYADKLPIKVAEMIRKNVPFAILIPLPLLNEIERTGKNSIDEEIRSKRLNMKLVVSTSLGQGWLINHPECRLDKTSHSIFFTTCTNKVLQDKAEDIFQEWAQTSLEYPSVKITPSDHDASDIDLACLYSIDALMNGTQKRTDSTEILDNNQDQNFNLNAQSAMTPREKRLRKRNIREVREGTENSSQEQGSTVGQDSTTTVPADPDSSNRQDTTEGQSSEITVPTADQEQCIRTTPHPLHVISTSLPPDPIETWPAKQTLDDIPSGMTRVPPENLKRGLPRSLIVLKDDKGRERILVPRCQRQRLVIKEHETMLHQSGARVNYELSRKYIWPNMVREIKAICKACHICQLSKVRRQNLSAEFEQADKDDIPLPRQAYGIDFYGHTKGEILVAIDLCTREVMLWFLKDRKMEGVTRALLSGLIFQKGVPLLFLNDEAKEFVDGTVHAMNQYLGIKQITTGGHNPRSNAIVERFMQHLTGCLTKCDDTQYKNIRDYLPAIAFAHNTAFNSVINCSPFEAGHGLRARTITEARASPRLQITPERGTGLQEPDEKWESTIFHKVCKLAERLADEAQRQSQWHKRMNSHNLNQSGKKIPEIPYSRGDKVYFYRPPSQNEVIKRERKAKHLMHYHGPATITQTIPGRRRQYEIEFEGKLYKRDVSMLIPQQTMQEIDPLTLDVVETPPSNTRPKLYKKGHTLREDSLVICKTETTDTEWFLAEISRVYPDEIEVIYYTTPIEQSENYTTADKEQRLETLRNARFRKSWYISAGKNVGKFTIQAPFPKNPELRLWTGKLPKNELDELIMATDLVLSPQGYLNKDSLDIASKLAIGHTATKTVEDEQAYKENMQVAHALYNYVQCTICNCAKCAKHLH